MRNRMDLEFFPISAVTGEGVEKLKYAMAEKVEEVRRASIETTEKEVLS